MSRLTALAHPMDKTNDSEVMHKMGKKQEMVRRFNFLSILALSTTLLSSWEAVAGVLRAGLYNGGPVSLVYGMFLSFIGTLALASSIAEMASSTPIAGAQYHWTSTYAPHKGAVFMSWMQGFDGAIHMSEEVQDSQRTVPRIVIWSIVINGFMAFGFLLTALFCIGNIEQAVNTPTGFSIIEIFNQATGSKMAATLMETCIIIIGFAASFGNMASVSRLTWAFARDGGLPFSGFFSFVNPTYRIPVRAIGLVSTIIVLLSLINLGSSTAFNAIVSLATIALYVSYIIPIFCLILKRLSGETINWGPWTLGRCGLAINIFAVCYGIFICIFLPFPPQTPVTALNMNYAAPVFAFVIILAVLDWFVRGRKVYTGPRRQVNNDQEGFTNELITSINQKA